VDEVAAAHWNAQVIVHYGRACLSSRRLRLPVLYVFGFLPFSAPTFVDSLVTSLEPHISSSSIESDDSSSSTSVVLVYYDVFYHYKADDLEQLLQPYSTRSSSSDANRWRVQLCRIDERLLTQISAEMSEEEGQLDERFNVIHGRLVPKDISEGQVKAVVWIGDSQSMTFSNLALRFNQAEVSREQHCRQFL
jgi:diphthamide biosynthesis enzyme Dph1/Dph2-like protein